jgi:hypothetical protein
MRMGEERKVYKDFLWLSPKERDHSEDRSVDGRMRSEWMLRRWAGWGCGVDSVDSGEGLVAGSCEHGDKPSSSGATKVVGAFCILHMSETRLRRAWKLLQTYCDHRKLTVNKYS